METPWFDLQIPIDLRFEKVRSKKDLLNRLKTIIINIPEPIYAQFLKEFVSQTMKSEIFQLFLKKFNCLEDVKNLFRSKMSEVPA